MQSGFICSAFVGSARARSGGRLYLQTRGSKFMKYQELKIQECVSISFHERHFVLYIQYIVHVNNFLYSSHLALGRMTRFPLETSLAP